VVDRVPVILDRAAERAWLDPDRSGTKLRHLLAPGPGWVHVRVRCFYRA
jgi:putative SOS response-associated peptidase YedK